MKSKDKLFFSTGHLSSMRGLGVIKQVMGRWVTANCEMENLLGVEVGDQIFTVFILF